MTDEKFSYIYTGPGGVDPQTPEEAEEGRRREGRREPVVIPPHAVMGTEMIDPEQRNRRQHALGN